MGFVGRLAQNAMNGKSSLFDTGSNRNLYFCMDSFKTIEEACTRLVKKNNSTPCAKVDRSEVCITPC